MELSSHRAGHPSESERAAVRELLEGARAGRGGALVVSGAPGSGKTVLLEEAERTAAELGLRILRTAGAQAEAEIPYAALQLIFHQHTARLAALPEAQRGALEVAFGLAAGPPPEPLPTGLGVLALLGALAAEGPLLLLVDDAQWLDGPTAQALLIAVRRLGAQPVAVLAAEQSVDRSLGVPELRLGLSAVLTAEAALDAGDLARATAAAAEAREPNPRLARVQAAVHFLRGSYPTAHQVLADAAAAAEPGLAARLLLQDLHIAWYLGEAAIADVARSLGDLRLPEGDPVAPLTRYAVPALLVALGEDAKLPPVREAVLEALRLGADLPRDLVQICGLTLAAGDDLTAHEFAAELAAAAAERRLTGLRPTLLFFLAEAELFHGRPADAREHAAEGLRLAEETGQRQWAGQLHGVLAYLAALAGDAERCRAAAERALRASGDDTPVSAGGGWAQWALGLLDLGEGRAEDAAARLAALADGRRRHTVAAVRALPDLVEAAVRIGAPERAEAPLARFERWAAATDQRWAESLVQRCRALLAPDELAESCHRAALAAATEDRPFERARTALLYGEWLRRARRRAESRQQLRQALEAFERLGAPHWAVRARTELDAAGAAAGEAQPPQTAGLTAQELRIVRLAARGLSNRDIAAQLFLSPRTVGYHLYKAYPKLGVTSRAELRHVVD